MKKKEFFTKLINKNKGIRLDLGCGENRQANFITLDKRPLPNVDIVWDVQKFPYPIPDDICHVVLMSHLWEHIEPKYRIDVMNELWRICKVGGQVLISTPYYQSFWACQDPSHYTCPTESTFTYFDPGYDLYKCYKPKPWKILRNDYTLEGCVEAILEKRAN